MIIIYFVILQLVYCNYICNYNIKTDFQTCNELMNYLGSPNFFDKYLERIGAEKIEYSPIIKENNFRFPQNVSYTFFPKITFMPSFLLKKIKVYHTWNKNEEGLKGVVNSDFLNFNISINSYLNNTNVDLNIKGTLLEKNAFVPNGVMDLMLEQFKNIFIYLQKK